MGFGPPTKAVEPSVVRKILWKKLRLKKIRPTELTKQIFSKITTERII
jgi:hypothetical protein